MNIAVLGLTKDNKYAVYSLPNVKYNKLSDGKWNSTILNVDSTKLKCLDISNINRTSLYAISCFNISGSKTTGFNIIMYDVSANKVGDTYAFTD